MKPLAAMAACAAVLCGCNPLEIEVDLPKRGEPVAIERRPPQGELPAHFRLRWAGGAADPHLVAGALHSEASRLCPGQSVAVLPGSRMDVEDHALDELMLEFHCQDLLLPNHVALPAGEPVPEQPGIPEGQERSYAWGAGIPFRAGADFERQFGSMVRDIFLDDCGGKGAILHRVASYTQPADSEGSPRLHVFIDYSCTD